MVTMTEEQIDDILFYARTGQVEEFQTLIKEFSLATNSTPADVIAASVEEQSQNTSLHMAAANCQLGKEMFRETHVALGLFFLNQPQISSII